MSRSSSWVPPVTVSLPSGGIEVALRDHQVARLEQAIVVAGALAGGGSVQDGLLALDRMRDMENEACRVRGLLRAVYDDAGTSEPHDLLWAALGWDLHWIGDGLSLAKLVTVSEIDKAIVAGGFGGGLRDAMVKNRFDLIDAAVAEVKGYDS